MQSWRGRTEVQEQVWAEDRDWGVLSEWRVLKPREDMRLTTEARESERSLVSTYLLAPLARSTAHTLLTHPSALQNYQFSPGRSSSFVSWHIPFPPGMAFPRLFLSSYFFRVQLGANYSAKLSLVSPLVTCLLPLMRWSYNISGLITPYTYLYMTPTTLEYNVYLSTKL